MSIRDDAEDDQDCEQCVRNQLHILADVQQERSLGVIVVEPVVGWAVLVALPLSPPNDQGDREAGGYREHRPYPVERSQRHVGSSRLPVVAEIDHVE